MEDGIRLTSMLENSDLPAGPGGPGLPEGPGSPVNPGSPESARNKLADSFMTKCSNHGPACGSI